MVYFLGNLQTYNTASSLSRDAACKHVMNYWLHHGAAESLSPELDSL